jgi:hypothetical protein
LVDSECILSKQADPLSVSELKVDLSGIVDPVELEVVVPKPTTEAVPLPFVRHGPKRAGVREDERTAGSENPRDLRHCAVRVAERHGSPITEGDVERLPAKRKLLGVRSKERIASSEFHLDPPGLSQPAPRDVEPHRPPTPSFDRRRPPARAAPQLEDPSAPNRAEEVQPSLRETEEAPGFGIRGAETPPMQPLVLLALGLPEATVSVDVPRPAGISRPSN